MNLNLNPPLPPSALTDDAMRLAAALLQIAADPGGTKKRLSDLNAATAALRDAIAQHDDAKTQADAAAAGLADIQQREQNLADRENALIAQQTRLNVASGAIADRDEQLKLRETAFDKRQVELAAKEQALADRLEKYRKALAG